MILDIHTYGNSQAAVNLVKILREQYPQCIRKVSSRIQRFNRGLFLLACNKNNNMKYDLSLLKNLMFMYREQQIRNAEKLNLPEIVKSHLLNVMHRSFNVWFNTLKI